jgi:hypothetical protein
MSTSKPRRIPIGDASDRRIRNEMALQAVEWFVRVMAGCGFSADLIARALENIPTDAPVPSPKRRRATDGEIFEAAYVVQLWCSRPDYVTDNGDPRKLPLRGRRRSIEALVRLASPLLDSDEVLSYLRRTKTVRRVRGSYELTRRFVLVHGVDGAAQERTMRGLITTLQTYHHNLICEEDEPSWFEMSVEDHLFPQSQIPKFDQFLRRQGLVWLRRLEAFMLRCQDAAKPGEPVCWVGANLHRTQQEVPLPLSLPRRSRRSLSPASRGTPR